MILLNDILVQEEVLHATFTCDVRRCKGACCTMPGGAGAPLAEEECALVRASVEAALPYLPETSREFLKHNDPVIGLRGDRSVACIEDADCVFVYYEDSVAKCAIERAYHNGASDFRKPLSCHLFPIRVADFGGPYLHYEKIEECEPGRALGEKVGAPLIESLREALIRAFGEDAYNRILAASRNEDEGDA